MRNIAFAVLLVACSTESRKVSLEAAPPCEPIRVGAITRGSSNVAVDGTHLYYITSYQGPLNPARLERIPVTGGPVEILADLADQRFIEMQLEGDYVYWTHLSGSRAQESLRRVPRVGGLVEGGGGGDFFAILGWDSEWMYFTYSAHDQPDTIARERRENFGVDTPYEILLELEWPSYFGSTFLAGDRVFFHQDGDLYAMPAEGGAPTVFLEDLGTVGTVVVEGDGAYFSRAGDLVRLSLLDATASIVATLPVAVQVRQLFVNSGELFALTEDEGALPPTHSAWRVATSGGELEEILRRAGAYAPTFALGATDLYWIQGDEAGAEAWRLPRNCAVTEPPPPSAIDAGVDPGGAPDAGPVPGGADAGSVPSAGDAGLPGEEEEEDPCLDDEGNPACSPDAGVTVPADAGVVPICDAG